MPRVAVIGGGYAGLACLIELAKKTPELELHLIDGQAVHCKTTNLHKTFVKPVNDFLVDYTELANRFHFEFHNQKLKFNSADLKIWHQTKKLPLEDGDLAFDFLAVCTGSQPILRPKNNETFGITTLKSGQGPKLLDCWIKEAAIRRIELSLVGAGTTGLQVLFELQEQLRRKRADCLLRLIDVGDRLATELPERAHRYILRKLHSEGIDYLPETQFLGQEDGQVLLREQKSGREYCLPSIASLLFPGVQRAPFALQCNSFGQVEVDGQLLSEVFSAGDCADYSCNGLNRLTAQAAVRKGRLVAYNIRNMNSNRELRRYGYQEKGYLLSLGSIDAVGWIGLSCNLIKGFSASVLKDAMETQYDLYLDGFDTYFGFP
ncbi:MAG: FAD-dependent oxidoreductase [Deltaproteobacteria bacterium]|jgi:NADH dehydrogenase|nr:FAD-dependent oxidoreductase [Deltaproteobacteria bacterium]